MIEENDYQKRTGFFEFGDSPRKPKSETGKTKIGRMKSRPLDVSFSRATRQNHTHILGSTGTGKSKLLEALIRQDILNKDCGLCLLDPHGSLYDEIVLYASHKYPHLADRFVLFNPAQDLEDVIGFNPIYDDANMDYLLNILISSCLKAWGQDDTTETPRITRWLGNIFYPIIKNDLTLLESPVLLNTRNKSERNVLLERVNNISVQNDWAMFDDAPVREKLSYIEGAANRLNRFLSNGIIRHIIGQNKNKLDFKKIMDEGKILLINLNGGERVSYENSQLLGIMIVNEIFRVAKLRNPRDRDLKPFYFYIDEFSQFVTKDIARSLDETRKFKLYMILAHQHLEQLKKEDEYLYASVMTNCKNKVVFGGLSVEDAEIMNQELQTGFVNLHKVKDEIHRTRVAYKWQEKESVSISEGSTETSNWSSSHSQSSSNNSSRAVNNSSSHFSSDSTNRSDTTSQSHSRSTGESYSNTENKGTSNRYSDQSMSAIGSSQTSNNAIARGHNSSSSYQEGSSHSRGYSHTDGFSSSQGVTETEGTSSTEGSSKSEGGASSRSTGRSVSTSTDFAPFSEEQELSSREFWSRDDLMYMKMAEMKNQGVAEAFIKTGSEAPFRCVVQDVRPVHYSERYSPEKIEQFRQKVVSKQTCYTPLQDAREEYRNRQTILFGQPLEFDDDLPDYNQTEGSNSKFNN